MPINDERWMHAALALGKRGLGRVWPNPSVGCVIVKDNRVIGRGWTQDGGRPHGEVMALAQAGEQAAGSTVYVTLEPCAHIGKSPPCAQALIDAKVARVVYACSDPDPRVNGKGAAMLRNAEIEVTPGVLHDLAETDHQGFFSRIIHQRPMVTLKLASSLDGRIATRTGESRWITGSAARQAVHLMRSQHDAILVGSGTALADDPDLGVRLDGLEATSPVRVVLDTNARLPLESRLVRTATQIPVWLGHGRDADSKRLTQLEAHGVILIECDVTNGSVDVNAALTALANKGITRVFCEGGGRLAGSLLKHKSVDHLICFSAGLVIGADGRPNMGPLEHDTLSQASRFTLKDYRKIGGDLLTHWVPD